METRSRFKGGQGRESRFWSLRKVEDDLVCEDSSLACGLIELRAWRGEHAALDVD